MIRAGDRLNFGGHVFNGGEGATPTPAGTQAGADETKPSMVVEDIDIVDLDDTFEPAAAAGIEEDPDDSVHQDTVLEMIVETDELDVPVRPAERTLVPQQPKGAKPTRASKNREAMAKKGKSLKKEKAAGKGLKGQKDAKRGAKASAAAKKAHSELNSQQKTIQKLRAQIAAVEARGA
jgi:hypothetical protein